MLSHVFYFMFLVFSPLLFFAFAGLFLCFSFLFDCFCLFFDFAVFCSWFLFGFACLLLHLFVFFVRSSLFLFFGLFPLCMFSYHLKAPSRINWLGVTPIPERTLCCPSGRRCALPQAPSSFRRTNINSAFHPINAWNLPTPLCASGALALVTFAKYIVISCSSARGALKSRKSFAFRARGSVSEVYLWVVFDYAEATWPKMIPYRLQHSPKMAELAPRWHQRSHKVALLDPKWSQHSSQKPT